MSSDYPERRQRYDARIAEIQERNRTVAHNDLDVIDPLARRLNEFLCDMSIPEKDRVRVRQIVMLIMADRRPS